MSATAKRAIYFSFFMFTADLLPHEPSYNKILIRHLTHLAGVGYDGFDRSFSEIPGGGGAAPDVRV
jgi:hypothetical protein